MLLADRWVMLAVDFAVIDACGPDLVDQPAVATAGQAAPAGSAHG
jgi:hypothetical protein